MKDDIKEDIIERFISAVDEASSFYYSDYCNSDEERTRREKEDNECIADFIELIQQL